MWFFPTDSMVASGQGSLQQEGGSYVHPIPPTLQSTPHFSETQTSNGQTKSSRALRSNNISPVQMVHVAEPNQVGQTDFIPRRRRSDPESSRSGDAATSPGRGECPDHPWVPQSAQALRARSSAHRFILNSHRNQETCKQNQTVNLFTKIREMESTCADGLPQVKQSQENLWS